MMYSRNITALVLLMIKEGALNLDFNDDILAGSCITHEGKVLHAGTRERLESASAAPAR
jgi:NAD(P) transhydrogenase subunit alpha